MHDIYKIYDEWNASDKTQRWGQFFMNRVGRDVIPHDPELFYEDNARWAWKHIIETYPEFFR